MEEEKSFYVELDDVKSVNDLLVQMLSYGYDINPKIENI